MESLAQTSQDYHKNAVCDPVKGTGNTGKLYPGCAGSLTELKKLGICFDCPSYRVAVFDMDTVFGTVSGGYA